MSPEEIRRIPNGDRTLRLREGNELYGVPEHRLRLYRAQRSLDFFKLGRAVFSEMSPNGQHAPADFRGITEPMPGAHNG
jgi:hypothetical protein